MLCETSPGKGKAHVHFSQHHQGQRRLLRGEQASMASWSANQRTTCAGRGRTGRGGHTVSEASVIAVTRAHEVKLYDCRDAYSGALEAMAAADERVCALVSDSVSSTKLKPFSQ